MENKRTPAIELIKSPEKPLFKAILMRHEEPFYKDEGHDLTEKGVEGAINTGKEIKESGFFNEEDPLHLFHSPKPRAEGTLNFVAQGAGLSTEGKKVINHIGQSKIADYETFMARVAEVGFNHELIAKDHYTNPMFENNPEVIEPHSKKKERLYRAVEYVLRSILKNEHSSTPQILAVSHFEIITHLIDDVFGIEEIGKYNSPSFGEKVEIKGYKDGESNNVILEVTFRDQKKRVLFNRENRSIDQIPQ